MAQIERNQRCFGLEYRMREDEMRRFWVTLLLLVSCCARHDYAPT
jgi:hypothetical protein